MSSDLTRCPECGLPKSDWLDDNCPACLMRLGAAAVRGSAALSSVCGATRSLGNYQLLEEIGRGGMGVVYRARQVGLNRQVAVKVLLGGPFANETFIKRFRREAEMAASLDHPNIVAIHEVSEHDGQLFFSMELIEGRSLAELSRGHPLPARQAAQVLKTIAEAIAFAHGRRLLHRDLKPSNVLLDELDVPHITDFGLAKRFDGDPDLTLSGQVLGTPNYMSPEQADPKQGPTTAASDVYSLGAILYQLLTGRPPFVAETVPRTLRLVSEGGPVAPRLLNPGVSRDLETICLKCLETEPRLRYPSAQEVADELGRVLKDEPIQARPASAVAKLARWCRRKPALAALLGIVAALLLVVGVGSPVALVHIHGARKLEEASRIRAEAAEREARWQLYAALAEQAHASVRSGEIGHRLQALDAIRRAAAISNSVELRGEALAALALPDLHLERELPTGAEFTLELMDPGFERVALCRGSGPVEIRALSDGRLLATLPATTNLPAYVGRWSADGRYLAVKRDYMLGGARADLEVWDTASAHRLLTLHDMVNSAVAFHPRLPRLIMAQTGGTATTWDFQTGRQISRLQMTGTPLGIKFAPDGDHFATMHASQDGCTVSVHDAQTGLLRASHKLSDLVMDLDWHPSGRWVATADRSGMVHLIDAQTGEARALGPHKAQAVTTVFTPDGGYLFSGGWEGELICWDLGRMRRSFTVERQSWNAQFRSDGRQCALFSKSGIQLYTFERPIDREFPEDLGPRLLHATFSPDGRWLAASADDALGVWDLAGTGPAALSREVAEARPVFTPDGKEVLAGGRGDKCAGWGISPGTNAGAPVLQPLDIPTPTGFSSLALASNLVVLTGAKGSRIDGLKSVAAAEPRWQRTVAGVSGVSEDGRWLGIYAPYTPWLHVYALPGLDRVTILTNRANVGGVAFSPAGDTVAVSSRNGLEFWSTETWARTRVLTNFINMLFSPDLSVYWLSRNYRSAGLFDARTLEPLLPLPMGTLPLALSRDGRYLAVNVDARRLQLWDLQEVRRHLRELGLDWQGGLAERAALKR